MRKSFTIIFKVFFGINITIENNKLKLDQANYIEKLLKEYGMKNSKNVSTPVVSMNLDLDNIIFDTCLQRLDKKSAFVDKKTPRYCVRS